MINAIYKVFLILQFRKTKEIPIIENYDLFEKAETPTFALLK